MNMHDWETGSGLGIPLTGPQRPNGQPSTIAWIGQEQPRWCWAACMEMVAPPAMTQCHIASVIKGHDCCTDPTGGNCRYGLLEANVPASYVKALGVRVAPSGGALAWDPLLAALAVAGWVLVKIRDGQVNHYVLAVGVREDSGQRFVIVNDPLGQGDKIQGPKKGPNGECSVLHGSLVAGGYRGARWRKSWLPEARATIAKAEP